MQPMATWLVKLTYNLALTPCSEERSATMAWHCPGNLKLWGSKTRFSWSPPFFFFLFFWAARFSDLLKVTNFSRLHGNPTTKPSKAKRLRGWLGATKFCLRAGPRKPWCGNSPFATNKPRGASRKAKKGFLYFETNPT